MIGGFFLFNSGMVGNQTSTVKIELPKVSGGSSARMSEALIAQVFGLALGDLYAAVLALNAVAY
jgi:hypothetical protein